MQNTFKKIYVNKIKPNLPVIFNVNLFDPKKKKMN